MTDEPVPGDMVPIRGGPLDGGKVMVAYVYPERLLRAFLWQLLDGVHRYEREDGAWIYKGVKEESPNGPE